MRQNTLRRPLETDREISSCYLDMPRSSYGSEGTDTSNPSIQGQRFVPGWFYDGFESGDTSAWSSGVP